MSPRRQRLEAACAGAGCPRRQADLVELLVDRARAGVPTIVRVRPPRGSSSRRYVYHVAPVRLQ